MTPKKRIIFSLIYDSGYFCQSRNFRLQRLGDINWLTDRYNFDTIRFAIDEMTVINASRHGSVDSQFLTTVEFLNSYLFVPLTVGGRIRTVSDAETLVSAGADKVLLNYAYVHDLELVGAIHEKFGKQACVASIDYRGEAAEAEAFTDFGEVPAGNLLTVLRRAQNAGFGDIVLNSIERDGTGYGIDIRTLKFLSTNLALLLIVSGGVGTPRHIGDALQLANVTGVATANLLNFVGDGLVKARLAVAQECLLPTWLDPREI